MSEQLDLTTSKKRAGESSEVAPAPSYYAGYGEYADAKSGGHLRDYWRSVRHYQWMVLALALLAAVGMAVYMARQPDIYEARARVQVDLETQSPALGASKNGPPIIASAVSDPTYFSTQLQVLSSSGLLRRVVKELDLEHDKDFLQQQKPAWGQETWSRLLGMFTPGARHRAEEQGTQKSRPQVGVVPPTPQSAAAPRPGDGAEVRPEDMEEVKRLAPFVDALQRNLSIEPVKDTRLQVKETRLIDIGYRHPNPQVAAKVVNAIAMSFASSNLERQTEANATAGDFLQKRIAELQSQIRDGEERLSSYAKSHEIISLDANQNTVAERLAGLNRQLLDAENDRKLAESAYESARAPGAATALAEGGSQQVAASEVKLADLRQRREQMLVEATEDWVEVKEVNRQIAELEKQIKESRQHATEVVLTNLETRYRQAVAREQSVADAYARQRSAALAQNDAAINYRIIQQEVETNRDLLEGLLQRSKENNVLLAALVGTPNNIHVTDYALVPGVPVGPKRLQGVAVAVLFALFAGVGLALFLSYMDDSVNSVADVEGALHLPAMASIPAVGGTTRGRLLRLPAAVLSRRGVLSQPAEQHPLLTGEDARSPLAEAYRQLRTSVLLSTAGHAPKTLLVTSSLQAEGKTTTAVNTALVLAQTGARVLVVDADMRKPSLHALLDVAPGGGGLSSILSSDMGEAEMLKSVSPYGETGLDVLPAGPKPPNPAELLSSKRMLALLKVCAENYTHVVIDSPPVTMFTDGVLISPNVDGVLLVVNCGKSSREVVRLSRKVLTDVGATIFGVVLNNVKTSVEAYHY